MKHWCIMRPELIIPLLVRTPNGARSPPERDAARVACSNDCRIPFDTPSLPPQGTNLESGLRLLVPDNFWRGVVGHLKLTEQQRAQLAAAMAMHEKCMARCGQRLDGRSRLEEVGPGSRLPFLGLNCGSVCIRSHTTPPPATAATACWRRERSCRPSWLRPTRTCPPTGATGACARASWHYCPSCGARPRRSWRPGPSAQ